MNKSRNKQADKEINKQTKKSSIFGLRFACFEFSFITLQHEPRKCNQVYFRHINRNVQQSIICYFEQPFYLFQKNKHKRQKDRKTERQKDRKAERQKDRKTERQKDRKTERQKDRKTEMSNKVLFVIFVLMQTNICRRS
jgi:hypothetical protein